MPVRWILFATLFAIGIDTYIIAAILPDIASDLGTTIAVVGLLASAYALPNALLAPVFGPLSDRFGRRIAMVAGMSVFTVAVAVSAVAPTVEILLVARVLNGLGAAITMPAVYAYIGDQTTEEERPRAMSTVLSAFPSSTLLGLPIGGFAASLAGWRAAFVVVLVVAVVALIAVIRLASDRERPGTVFSYRASLVRVLRDRRTVGALGVTAIWFTAALGMFPYVGEFLRRTYGFDSGQIGLVFMLIGVVGLASTRLGGRFIGAVGAKRAVMLGIGCYATAVFLLPLTAVAVPVTLAVFALWIFGVWFGLPAQQSIVSDLMPDSRGTVLAFNSSALYLGGVFGPALAGAILDVGGFELLAPVAAATALAAIALAGVVLPGHMAGVEADADAMEPAAS